MCGPSGRKMTPTCPPDVLALVVPCLALAVVAASLRERTRTHVVSHRAQGPLSPKSAYKVPLWVSYTKFSSSLITVADRTHKVIREVEAAPH